MVWYLSLIHIFLPPYEIFAQNSSLGREEYLTIAGFTAIVRLANALDRSHMQKIQSVRATLKEQELILNLTVNRDFTLEEGLAREKADFFCEVFSIMPILHLKRQM